MEVILDWELLLTILLGLFLLIGSLLGWLLLLRTVGLALRLLLQLVEAVDDVPVLVLAAVAFIEDVDVDLLLV